MPPRTKTETNFRFKGQQIFVAEVLFKIFQQVWTQCKQGVDLQYNALTSLVHFAVQQHKVELGM